MKTATELVANLKANQQTISVAESCTGGLLAGLITSVAGASDVFNQGYITYSNAAKSKLLGVSETLLIEHGAVSEQVAAAMAEGARSAASADIALSITGIAGPGGGTADKPVGLVYIACAKAHSAKTEKHIFLGDRQQVRLQACAAAVEMARNN